MAFEIVPETKWRLSETLDPARRRRLLSMRFDKIVECIAEEARIQDQPSRECMRDHPGFFRLRLALNVPAEALDAWHNGAGGYRAQFFLGEASGELANRHALKMLMQPLQHMIERLHGASVGWDFVAASLEHSDAKCWIDESFMGRPKPLRFDLNVDRWQESGRTKPPPENVQAQDLWKAFLTPHRGRLLTIKGGMLDAHDAPSDRRAKLARSRELFDFGIS